MPNQIAKSLFFILFAAISTNTLSAGTIFKCKNQQGILIYQNSACKDDAETLTSWEHKDKPKPVEEETDKDKAAKKEAAPVLTLKQNAAGHYVTDGNVDR